MRAGSRKLSASRCTNLIVRTCWAWSSSPCFSCQFRSWDQSLDDHWTQNLIKKNSTSSVGILMIGLKESTRRKLGKLKTTMILFRFQEVLIGSILSRRMGRVRRTGWVRTIASALPSQMKLKILSTRFFSRWKCWKNSRILMSNSLISRCMRRARGKLRILIGRWRDRIWFLRTLASTSSSLMRRFRIALISQKLWISFLLSLKGNRSSIEIRQGKQANLLWRKEGSRLKLALRWRRSISVKSRHSARLLKKSLLRKKTFRRLLETG